MNRLTEDEIRILNEPFPDEAYTSYKKGKNAPEFTTLKAAYLIERLHRAFGQGNVLINHQLVALYDNKLMQVSGDIRILRGGGSSMYIPFHGLGEIDFKGATDAYKSIVTDSISKAVFHNLLLGVDMFKGLIPVRDGVPVRKEEVKTFTKSAAAAKGELRALYKQDRGRFDALMETAEMKDTKLNDLTDEQWIFVHNLYKMNGSVASV